MTHPAVPAGTYPRAVEAALDAALARVVALLGPSNSAAVGWATVDLERAAAELGVAAGSALSLPDDVLLGARCRLAPPSAPGPPLVLLEPSTEGRLAASLARFGEGPVVLYLGVPARTLARLRVVGPASGVHCSRPAPGPFGESVVLLGGPPSGPHLVVTEAAAAGTIES